LNRCCTRVRLREPSLYRVQIRYASEHMITRIRWLTRQRNNSKTGRAGREQNERGAGVAGAHHLCCNGDGSPSTSRSVPHWMQPTFPSFAPNIHCQPTHTEPYLKLGDPLGCVSLVLRLVEEEAAVLSAPGITVSPAKTCAGLFQLRTPAAPDAHLTYVTKCTCRCSGATFRHDTSGDSCGKQTLGFSGRVCLCVHALRGFQQNVGRLPVVEHLSADLSHRVLSFLQSSRKTRCDSMTCSQCRPML
jgi:hypothetical protein